MPSLAMEGSQWKCRAAAPDDFLFLFLFHCLSDGQGHARSSAAPVTLRHPVSEGEASI